MTSRRIFVPGVSHHVRHRGNNRCAIFKDDHDRAQFLALFRKVARKYGVSVHGYVLMTTHYHAVVTGHGPESLPRTFQALASRYVRHFNDRHHRTGTLWEGRYRASLIRDERYWLTCLRYVERNPLAAGMVVHAGDYQWSSYRANACGSPDLLLTPHPLYLQLGSDVATRSANWANLCGVPVCEAEAAEIRVRIRHGQPIGNEDGGETPVELPSSIG